MESRLWIRNRQELIPVSWARKESSRHWCSEWTVFDGPRVGAWASKVEATLTGISLVRIVVTDPLTLRSQLWSEDFGDILFSCEQVLNDAVHRTYPSPRVSSSIVQVVEVA